MRQFQLFHETSGRKGLNPSPAKEGGYKKEELEKVKKSKEFWDIYSIDHFCTQYRRKATAFLIELNKKGAQSKIILFYI